MNTINTNFKPIIGHTTGTCGYYVSNTGVVIKITTAESGDLDILECAQCINNSGYKYFNADGERLFIAPEMWRAFNGEIPDGLQVDHIDRNTENNVLSNLRLLTPQQQAWNKTIPMAPRRLHQDKNGKWYFNMVAVGKKIPTPKYETPEDALKGYVEYRELKVQRYADELAKSLGI